MRCHRCHSKIDPGRKMCPVCGTLVKKPRGAFKVSRDAGGSALGDLFARAGDFFAGIDLKTVLAFLCGAALIAVILMTFNCGSCDRSGGFSSCGSPSSCAACQTVGQSFSSCASSCSSCRESCADGCASSDSDTANGPAVSDSAPRDGVTGDSQSAAAVQPAPEETAAAQVTSPSEHSSHTKPLSSVEVRQGGASCAGRARGEDEPVFEKSVNSAANGREYFYDGNLYYINASGICCTNDRAETVLLIPGSGISALYADSGVLYYTQSGELWCVSAESAADARCLIRTSGEDSSTVLSRVYGFGISGGYLCCWGPVGEDGFAITSRAIGGGDETVLYSGQCAQQQVYRGRVYYLSREEDDLNTLYGVPLEGGRTQKMMKLPVSYFAPCDGSIFAYTWIDGEASLYRIDCGTLKALAGWDFVPVRGLNADDTRLWYYCNNADGTSGVYSMNPDGSDNRQLYADHGVIQLGHIAERYYSLYTGIDESADNRLAAARYFIIDGSTGDRQLVK